MAARIEDLENAVSLVIKRMSELRRSPPGHADAPPPSSETEETLRNLAEENRRLLEERKSLRKRVRNIIREIDKVKW